MSDTKDITVRFDRGTMVFWGDRVPWWVVEWQPNNGIEGSYWIVNAKGESGCTGEDELTLFPQSAGATS